jgi:glycosyltransferase involved in cell wall biosynthesis
LYFKEKQVHTSALVSVVIPTRGRPEWVGRAVESALAQSYASLEVIVVVDGPDPETVLVLKRITDTRLKALLLEENAGGAEARNVGVRAACGEWIAFLDDDDAWVPEKLEKQMKFAAALQASCLIVSSRLLARSEATERVLPRRLYAPGSDVSEYLFCRRGFAYGDGMLQASTLLVKRALLLEVPFVKGLKRHQDWDWLLKAAQHADVVVAMLPDVLTVMRVEGANESVSRSADWEFSLAWARENRPRMSRKAYSFFVTTECVPRARKSGAGALILLQLLWECIRFGQPGLRQMALFLCFCALPERTRRGLRDRTIRTARVTESGA